ncbi:MAG: ATP-binding protein [Nakamurella sp.]
MTQFLSTRHHNKDSPLGMLLEAASRAIDRRAQAGWDKADLARAALAAAPNTDPLVDSVPTLARFAGLDASEIRLLVVGLAAELDQNLHLLTGLLSGDEKPQRPTVAVALELADLAPTAADARSLLAELGTLRRHGLLRLTGDAPLIARRIMVPDRVTAHLLGDDLPAAAILPLLDEPAPLDMPGTSVIADAIRSNHMLIWVHNPPGAAGTAMASAACRSLDVPCLQADLRRLPGTSENPADPGSSNLLLAALDALLLEATLTGSVLILSGAELIAPITDRLAHPALPVIAVGTAPWDPTWPPVELPLSVTAPRVGIAARSALWRPVLGGQEPDPQIAALRLSPEDINRVTQLAQADTQQTGPPDIVAIRHATRRLGRNRSSKFASSSDPATMDDLVLPAHTRSEVSRLLDWARYRDEVLAQGPLQGKGGKGTGICALFAGNPGTGKSLAAHVVADTLGMDLYTVDISSMVDKYVGETEKNLERVFTEAESLNAVLFFDEADSLFGSRSEVRDAHDRYANQEVAYLLQRMEQFDGITILATNLRGNLDPAFSRRLHFVIHFPDPDEMTKRHLWDYHLGHLGRIDSADPIDIDALARTLDLSGGDIRNIVLSAAYEATATQAAVGMRHVVAAAGREYAKLGRRAPVGSIFPAPPTAR